VRIPAVAVQFLPLLRIPALGWTLSIPALAPLPFLPRALIRVRRRARVQLPALAQLRMYRREPAPQAAATPVSRTRPAVEQWE
jgi:hypothetical protein